VLYFLNVGAATGDEMPGHGGVVGGFLLPGILQRAGEGDEGLEVSVTHGIHYPCFFVVLVFFVVSIFLSGMMILDFDWKRKRVRSRDGLLKPLFQPVSIRMEWRIFREVEGQGINWRMLGRNADRKRHRGGDAPVDGLARDAPATTRQPQRASHNAPATTR
jgi:hypothetical protein